MPSRSAIQEASSPGKDSSSSIDALSGDESSTHSAHRVPGMSDDVDSLLGAVRLSRASKPIGFERVTLDQARVRPHLEYVLPGLLEKTVGVIVGAGAVGKSMLSLQIGLAVAGGRPVAGGLWPAGEKAKVTLVFGEDAAVIIQERLHWLMTAEKLSAREQDEIDQNLHIFSGVAKDLRILQKTQLGLVETSAFAELIALCRGQRLVVLDPLAFLSDVDENDNAAMTQLMRLLAECAAITGAAIVVLHHASKSGASGATVGASIARGASAITNHARWQLNLTTPTAEQIKALNLPADSASRWVNLAIPKANYCTFQPDQWLERIDGGALCLGHPSKNAAALAAGTAHAKQHQPASSRQRLVKRDQA